MVRMEDLVQAIPAGMHLQRVREKDKDDDGQLAESDEKRSGRVHRNDVGTDLMG